MEPDDRDSLIALERASPEGGLLRTRVELRASHAELAGRYGAWEGYVAVPDGGAPARGGRPVIGMLLASLAPTQWGGEVIPAVYLFALRVHPAWRRRGIASALVDHAWGRATARGAALAWALVAPGNTASLRTFARAGFSSLPEGRVRVLLPPPAPWVSPPRVPWVHRRGADEPGGPWHVCAATPADLPDLASGLNEAHARHDLWRRLTPEGLAEQLALPGHGVADVLLAVNRRGEPGAAVTVLHTHRIARARLLAPLRSALPVRPRLLRQRMFAPRYPGAGRALLRYLTQPPRGDWFSPLVVPMDPRDPAWGTVREPSGFSVRLHVLARRTGSAAPPSGRPLYLG